MATRMFIDGEWCDAASGRTTEATSPATGESLGDVAWGDRGDAQRAIAAARAAFPAWEARTAFERAAMLHRIADACERRKDELARINTLDQGKPLAAEAVVEVGELIEFWRMAAEDGIRLEGSIPASAAPGRRVLLLRRPLGADLAVLIVLYTLAASRPRRISLRGLAICLAGAATAIWRWHPVHPVDGLYTVGVETALFGGPVLLAWLLGDSVRWRRGYYQALEERAARLERERDAQAQVAAAAERARIAREIHDVVAHNVSVMVVQADGAAFALDASPGGTAISRPARSWPRSRASTSSASCSGRPARPGCRCPSPCPACPGRCPRARRWPCTGSFRSR